jgi:heme/copper-type cytochrome/quinol oxidase subunit 1
MVMPRINGVSYWLLLVAVVVLLFCQVVFVRPVCSGWTLYPPLITRDGDALCVATDLSLMCVHVLGLSSGLGAFNYLATFRTARH